MNMAWSPDGQRIAVGDRSDNISIFDAAAAVQMASEKQPCEVRPLHRSPAYCVKTNEIAFTNNSKALICASAANKGGQIRILSVSDLSEAHSWLANTSGLLTLDVDPRGRCVDADVRPFRHVCRPAARRMSGIGRADIGQVHRGRRPRHARQPVDPARLCLRQDTAAA